jgi:hypothetical protein
MCFLEKKNERKKRRSQSNCHKRKCKLQRVFQGHVWLEEISLDIRWLEWYLSGDIGINWLLQLAKLA